MKERCLKYLKDLYNVVWDDEDTLRPSKPIPTVEEKLKTRETCLERLMDFIPCTFPSEITLIKYFLQKSDKGEKGPIHNI